MKKERNTRAKALAELAERTKGERNNKMRKYEDDGEGVPEERKKKVISDLVHEFYKQDKKSKKEKKVKKEKKAKKEKRRKHKEWLEGIPEGKEEEEEGQEGELSIIEDKGTV